MYVCDYVDRWTDRLMHGQADRWMDKLKYMVDGVAQ